MQTAASVHSAGDLLKGPELATAATRTLLNLHDIYIWSVVGIGVAAWLIVGVFAVR